LSIRNVWVIYLSCMDFEEKEMKDIEDNTEMVERMKRLVKNTALELSEIVGDILAEKSNHKEGIHPPEFILNYFSLTLQFIEHLTKEIPESMRYVVETTKNVGLDVHQVRDKSSEK